MPLSRLENFIKNVEGTILYVNPTDQDATDSIENQGNSLTRPFKTIQRALIEAARFSFVAGKDNDKFDKTTILVYPGVHKIDNRAGLSIDNNGGSAEYKDRFGNVASFSELTASSNFDIEDSANVLHYFNSVSGGVIIPRGTSLVGLDLRKTKVLPLFVPDPQNSEIDNTAIFKVTGGCYFWQFSIFDGDPNGTVYKNYSSTRFTPNFSHHKLTCFEYADGNNTISLGAVTGGTAVSNDQTDLDSYYFKVANAYGSSSGREVPSWPTNEVLQPKLAENQIVGAVQADAIGITSVFSTNKTDYTFSGAVGRNVVVTTTSAHNLNVGTPIIVSGITTNSTATSNDPTFNAEGGTVVAEVISSTQFAFVASEDTVVTNPHLSGDETVQVEPDTVTGASPYIFNLSLRSVYGVNGLHADGSKATGFKSMVLAQFTGIGLQKDDNAFLLYNESTGTYNDTTTVADSAKPLHINSKAIYKPAYESTHVKVSNGAVLQCVSIFAIGFANHFVADTGGDQSITNSNSNFGAKALIARGFRDTAFARDNSGYITHVIPPKNVVKEEESSFWVPLNVGLTTEYTVGAGSSTRLYTFGYSDEDVPPTHIIDQFRIGSKVGDQLKLEVNNVTQTADIVMDGSTTATNQKIAYVSRNTAGTANSITESSGSIFGLTGNHEFADGETVRILSDDGTIPDGIELDQKYFVIKTGLNADQIKLAKTFNEAISSNTSPIEDVNTTGGALRIISAVADKFPGDAGHPIQYDDTRNNWYINVKGDGTNKIYKAIENSTTNVTSKSFISRKGDNRNLEDRIYKIRYVIPKEFQNAKPPAAGYVLQESSSTIVENNSEYSSSIANLTDFRNLKVIHNIEYSETSGIATVTSEIPHRVTSGAKVKLNKVSSSNNTAATDKKGFNGTFDVESIVDSKSFTVNVPSVRDPGDFLTNRPAAVTDRDENHPNFSINEYSEVYYIYRVNEISEYEQDIQDGVYHLTCLLGSVNPSSSYFADRGFSQNVVNLYPMLDRDNYTMDPSGALSIASNKTISEVETGDLTQSITKEFVNSLLVNNRYGFNITDLTYDQTTGITTATTDVQHNLNNVINVSIADSGSGFGFSGVSTTIYNAKLTGGTGEGATIRFTTNTGGNFSLTSPVIVDGGSGYSVGDTLTVSTVGIPTFSGGGVNYSEASLTVVSVNQATENSIQIEDVIDYGEKTNEFNGVYRILSVPDSKKVSFLLPPSNSGIGTFKKNGKFIPAGSLSTITSIDYTDSSTGIVTVTCDSAHGLNIGNAFKIDYNDESSLTSSIYNGNFIVNERIGINTFTFKIGQGIATATPPSNVGYVLPTGYTAQEADSDLSRENIARRMNSFYVGISSTISSEITTSATSVTLSNADGFEKGDFIEIGTEIVRVKNSFSSNQADILRGLFGTRVVAHPAGTIAKKIKPIPVEGRRYSILRASGHTFEYVGFGPGNYSNALPQRQDRILDKTEQLLSQSEKTDGGVVVYTGMNDSGDFYVGNRRLSSATGQEETIGIPVPRFVGDDGDDTRLSVVFDDVTVKEFIKVEGGAGNVLASEFNGPVVFNNKTNFNSDLGSDFKFITLKGTDPDNTRRKYTVGIATPLADADNSVGDVVWKNDPVPGGYAGWIFAGDKGSENNKWRKFGLIASEDAEQDTDTDSNINSPLGNFTILPSKIGINTNTPQSVIEVKDGLTRLDRLYVAGIATFQDSVTLTNVTLDDLTINDRLSVSGSVSIDAPGGYVLSGNRLITGLTTHTGDYDLVGGLQVENSASVGGTLTVSGNTDLNRNLQVSGNTSLKGALSVSGITTLGNKLNVSGSLCVNGSSILSGAIQAKTTLSVGQDLNVNNNASVGGTLKVFGDTSLDGGLNVSAATVLKAGLTVSGNADLNKDLTVSGSTSLNGTLRVLGNTSLDDALTVSGPTTIKNTLTVSGNTDLNRSLSVSGDASVGAALTVTGATNIGGTLCVGGDTQLKGNASVGGTLRVEGNTSLDKNLTVSGGTVLKQTLTVSGNTSLDKDLTVSGNTNLKGTLTVSGLADLNQNLQVSGNTQLGGTLQVTGESEFQSKLSANTISASGQVIVDQQVQADGAVLAGGTLRAGGSLCAQAQAFVNQNFRVTQDSQLKGNASVGGRLDVAGQVSIGGQLNISGGANPKIDLKSNTSGQPLINFSRQVGGVDTLGTRLRLTGDNRFIVSGANEIKVSGNTSVEGKVVVTGNLSVGGILSANSAAITGDVTVSSLLTQGRLQAQGNLSVAGTGTIKETLFVSGNASVGGTLCVEGQAFFNSDIDISGNALYAGRLSVSGDVNLNSVAGVTTTRQLDVNGDLGASGLVCAGTMRVIGTTCLDNLDVNNTASFASTVQIAGNTSVGGTLSVAAKLTALANLSVGQDAIVNRNLTAGGTLSVDGKAHLKSDVSTGGNLILGDGNNPNINLRSNTSGLPNINFARQIGGVSTTGVRLRLTGDSRFVIDDATEIKLGGSVSVDNNFTVQQTTQLKGNASVGGTLSVAGALTVAGESDFQAKLNANNISSSGALQVQGQISTDGSVRATQNLNAGQNLCVGANAQIKGNASVGGTLSVAGNATLARAVVTGNLSVGGTFSAAGSANIAGDVTVSSLKTEGRLRSAGTLCIVGDTQLKGNASVGGTLSVAGATTLQNTLTVTSTTALQGNTVVDGTICSTGDITIERPSPVIRLRSTLSGNPAVNFSRQVDGVAQQFGARIRLTDDNALGIQFPSQINGTVNIAGTLSVGQNAIVKGNTTICGTLTVSGESDFQTKINTNNISSSGQLQVQGQISATGGLIADGNLHVGGTACIGSTTQLKGNASVGGTLSVASVTTLQSTLTVVGESDFQSKLNANNVSLSGELHVGDQTNPHLELEGNADNSQPYIDFARTVGGQAQDYGARLRLTGNNIFAVQFPAAGGSFRVNNASICVAQNAVIKGNTTVCGTLTVSGTSQLKGNTSVGGTLSVNGKLTAMSSLSVGDGASISGALKVGGTASLQGGLVVDGESDFQSKLSANTVSASGQITADGGIIATGGLKGASLQVAGTACLGGTTCVIGSFIARQTGYVSGKLTAKGQLSAGGQVIAVGQGVFGGAVTVSTNLHVRGTACVGGAMQVKSNLSGGGNVKAASALFAGTSLHVAGSACIGTSMQVKSGLSVGGAFRCASICAQSFEQDGNAPTYACRAYGKVLNETQVKGKNVTSVSYLGGSKVRVTFTQDMPSTGYAVVLTTGGGEPDTTSSVEETQTNRFVYKSADAGQGNNVSAGFSRVQFVVYA